MHANRAGLLAILTLLIGCAGKPPPSPQPQASQSGQAKVVNAALSEWRAWGQLSIDGWPDALPSEPSPDNFGRILTYWSHVEEGPAVIRRHQETHDALLQSLSDDAYGAGPTVPVPQPAISLWAYPAWSAAFISHVMAQAGVPAFVFPPRASHAGYIDSLLYTALSSPETAAFLPQDPNAYAARPGDLLCADRAALKLTHWQDRLSEAGQFRPMHCDVVVANGSGVVQAIGGNVKDAVVLRRFPADAAGHVLPAPYDKPQFFLIFQNRL